MRPAIRTVLFSVILSAGALLASADVRNPVRIRLLPKPPAPAVTGEVYRGLLEITAPFDGIIDRIEIGGGGWRARAVELPEDTEVPARTPIEVPFVADVLDSTQPLEVRVSFEGQVTVKRFDLRPERMAAIGRDLGTVGVDVADTPAGEAGGGGVAGCEDQTIRVRGRFEYVRMDGQVIGADGIRYQIMDEDTIDSELMFESFTDEQGNFDVTICWDDCDATGCDDPDVYLRFECNTNVCLVRNNDAGEDTFAWSTIDSMIFNDYEGNDLNFGTHRPDDPADFPAVHMHNSMTRAHRFILEHNGFNMHQATVIWEDDGGSFYQPVGNEIHISPSGQWDEATHTHEWGHHLMYEWTDPLPVDYCNGFCDGDPANPPCGMDACANGGHCLWCRETDHDAWNEGFPDWLAMSLMGRWQTRYGGPAPIGINRYPIETLQTCCDGNFHDSIRTEGFVAALLNDMDDPVRDTGQSACPQDALALGPDEILAVVRNARPLRVLEFINAFRTAHPNLEFDFRATALAVSPDYVTGWNTPVLQVLSTDGCGTYRTGETIVLSVDTNASSLSTCMQWQRNGTNLADDGRITGATTDVLTIQNANGADAGRYALQVRSCDGLPPNACNGSHSRTSPPISVRIIDANPVGHRITGWGRNLNGSLGRGTTVPDADEHPADVINLTNAVSVAAGYWNSFALLADGTVWGWGSRFLGNGTNQASATPVQVNNLTNVVAVASGSPEGNGMALDANGHVWTWGSNWDFALGYHAVNGFVLNPGQVNLECVVDISMGNNHCAAITSDGSLWMWGANAQGQLGQGHNTSMQNPVRVEDLTDVVDVSCGGGHTLALRADGTLWAAGWNGYGQLGDGTTQNRNRFVQVPGLGPVAGIAAGQLHTVVRLANGQAWAWGLNLNQALGTGGPEVATPVPARVLNVGTVRSLDAGYQNSVFVTEDGTIWTCGSNFAGGLGRPFLTGADYLPAPVYASVGAAVQISAGTNFVMVIAPGARISAQIPSQFVAGSSTAQFTVNAVGEPPINYQWGRYVSGLFSPLSDTPPISGSNTATLSISPTTPMHSEFYQVRVSNATNTVFSNPIRLSTPPFLNTFSAASDIADWWDNERGIWTTTDGLYAAGAPGIFPPNVTYNSFRYPTTDFMIELDVVNASHANFNTNGGIWLRSQLGTLPYPQGVVLAWGDVASWGGGDVYWQFNQGSGFNGATNIANNIFSAGQTLHLRMEVRGDTYTCWANDAPTPTTSFVHTGFPAGEIALLDGVAGGTAFDNIFIQTLTNCPPESGNEPVRIIQRPLSQSVASGTPVSLNVVATGTGPLSYQWLHHGYALPGQTGPTLSLTASAGTTGRYECTVTNACGSVGSYPAFVTLANEIPADLSCDGVVNNFDIDPFVLAITNPAAYQAAYPNCPISNADVNGDGLVNNFDIDVFVACIVNGGCP